MIVQVKNYEPSPVNVKEILRYAGVKISTEEINQLIAECLKEVESCVKFGVCYAEFPISPLENGVDLGFGKINSTNLAKNLKGCDFCVVFCATIGFGIDRLIAKYNVISPAKALIFQAIGAERIESLCNLFCKEIEKNHKCVKPRFSPGYGDFSVEFQREIFNVLDCSKKLGVTLTESLLMTPTKSVTAIVGVCNETQTQEESACQNCTKTDCDYRK